MEKARSLAQDPRLGMEGYIKFSEGWLRNFKKRHGICGFLLHGERGEVSREAGAHSIHLHVVCLSTHNL